MRYKTVWVKEWIDSSSGAVLECANVDSVVNAAASDGWTLHTIVPATSFGSNSGLFITFQRAD